MVNIIWTKEVEEKVEETILRGANNGDTVTMNTFHNIIPEYSIRNLATRVKKTAMMLGYSIDGLFSTNPDKPLVIRKFNTDGDPAIPIMWSGKHDAKLLEIILNNKKLTLRQLVETFNCPSIQIEERLKAVASDNDVQVWGLGTKVEPGTNRLDLVLEIKDFNEYRILTERVSKKKKGITKYKVLVQLLDGTAHWIKVKAANEEGAIKKARTISKKADKIVKVVEIN